MNFVFQLIRHANGERSEPFTGDWDTVAAAITEHEETDQEDYILLVAVIDPDDPDQMTIPKTPLIKLSTFMEIRDKRQQLEETA